MRIEHVALWVEDLELMKDFYSKYFEAIPNEKYTNSANGFSSYFLSFNAGCRLELMNMPNIKEKLSPRGYDMGLAHFTFSTGSKDRVDDLTETLRQNGFEIFGEPRTTGDGYYESVVKDPEGNYVEISI